VATACLLSGAAPNPALARGWRVSRHERVSAHRDELIPLYDDANASEWSTACSEADGANGGSWIIANPAGVEGPGSGPVPAWASVIEDCYDYGRASVIGYVWTDYGEGGTASIPAIEHQIEEWYADYPGDIAGIFFDGVADARPDTGESNEAFYRTLATFLHEHEGNNDEVAFNFGQNPGSDWMLDGNDNENADIVATFEGSYDTPGENPYTSWTQAAWEEQYPAEDFAALIYGATSTSLTPQPASACSSFASAERGVRLRGHVVRSVARRIRLARRGMLSGGPRSTAERRSVRVTHWR
jgi:Spherulation-specific family 4